MASHLIGQHPVSTFVTPVAGTSPIDANVVRSNDNTNGSTYTAHDADPTIHVQDSILASRSAASTAGRKWLTTDASAFYLFYDDGTSWNEISYARTASPSFTGAVTITSSSANALAVGLNGATNPAFNVDSSTALQVAGLNVIGAITGGTVAVAVTDSGSNASLTINAKGSGTIGIGSVSTGRVTITPVTTITGILTLTAQPILSSLTASQAVFTDGSKGLVSVAVTGTGNVVRSADQTLTGTLTAAIANFSGAVTASVSSGTAVSAGTSNMSQPVKIGEVSDSTLYGVVTFNNAFTSAGLLGIQARGATDLNLYFNVPTGGGIKFNVNGGTAIQMVTAGQLQFANISATPAGLADGQVWYDGTNLRARLGGATKTITVT